MGVSPSSITSQQKLIRERTGEIDHQARTFLNRLKLMNVINNSDTGSIANEEELCSYVKMIYRNELQKLSIELLKDQNQRLGLESIKGQQTKQSLCNSVYKYYAKKIDTVMKIREQLQSPLLRAQTDIVSNWTLQYAHLGSEKRQKTSLVMMEKFTRCLSNYYNRLLKNLKIITETDMNMKQLQQFSDDTDKLVANGTKSCCLLANQLNHFAWTAHTDQATGKTYYVRGQETSWEIPSVPSTSSSSSSSSSMSSAEDDSSFGSSDYDVCSV